ncbi:ABC transporter substrate-binding protein [Haloarcula salina]|uniref:ABC transporter substrate-binding protein n=1 Tax=Haloarcula salina TaxID=1429914 RepID=A0AA41G4Q0_9EURY|nr:ABC transporter substrate-binding protein [Haloarcula salina]MBV0903556.1 ABC transporter substrate-binding protein [Haloarcula salina]
MTDDADSRRSPTRRDALKFGGALLGGGLLAGCAGSGDSATPTSQSTGDGSDGATTPTDAADGQSTTTEGYTVSMSPVGDVRFDAVPEEVFTVYPQYLDMAVALGHGERVNSVYVPEMSGTTMNHYYHHLDGVSLDWEGLHDPLTDGFSKESLYERGSDVHLADPAWVSTQEGWSTDDVAEVASTLAPWVGNFYSGTHDAPPEGYADYRYYTLWELFGKVAEVFQERARYEALAQVHADLVSHVQSNLPPREERPTAVRATLSSDGSKFWTYHLNEPGYWLADTRPLGANDAFGDEEWNGLWGTVDYEVMLEADPDVFLHLWGLTPSYSMADTRSKLEDNAAGSQLTAVKEGRVYPAGMRYQGPIMNLFQIEMGAKQLYPDVFGAWPTYEDGDHYPEIPEDERLFDRQRVADIVTGDY